MESKRKKYDIIVENNVPCKLRDGTTLLSDIYRPILTGRFPVILHRTPYNKDNIAMGIGVQIHPVHAAREGYVVVVQDVRGRFSSEGKFDAFANEKEDGFDTVQWCSSLPFSSAKVGMFGGSYTGVTQLLAASSSPPQLLAVSPRQTSANYYLGWTYQGGAFLLAFNFLWSISLALDELHRANLSLEDERKAREALGNSADNLNQICSTLPLTDIQIFRSYGVSKYFYDWLSHPTYDEFWKKIDVERSFSEMDVAGLHIAGWYDIFLQGTIRTYLGLTARQSPSRKKQRMIIGPWRHGTDLGNLIGEWNAGFDAQGVTMGIESMQLRWFDLWLKREKSKLDSDERSCPISIYIMGENRWRAENEWPLKRTKYVNFYFHSNGRANSLSGDGWLSRRAPSTEPPDKFTYRPDDPCPTRGGATTGAQPAALPDGVFDQRPVEERNDVLVYTSDSIREDLEITGPAMVVLHASSSAPDTDFTAKLLDVHPNNYSRNLCDGIIRARYRNSFELAAFLELGKIHEFRIDLGATSNLFKKRHRIRVEVSSSNFPRFDRNLNVACRSDEFYLNRKASIAEQSIHHSQLDPSCVILPIVSRS